VESYPQSYGFTRYLRERRFIFTTIIFNCVCGIIFQIPLKAVEKRGDVSSRKQKDVEESHAQSHEFM
jgi:hypothetical protein